MGSSNEGDPLWEGSSSPETPFKGFKDYKRTYGNDILEPSRRFKSRDLVRDGPFREDAKEYLFYWDPKQLMWDSAKEHEQRFGKHHWFAFIGTAFIGGGLWGAFKGFITLIATPKALDRPIIDTMAIGYKRMPIHFMRSAHQFTLIACEGVVAYAVTKFTRQQLMRSTEHQEYHPLDYIVPAQIVALNYMSPGVIWVANGLLAYAIMHVCKKLWDPKYGYVPSPMKRYKQLHDGYKNGPRDEPIQIRHSTANQGDPLTWQHPAKPGYFDNFFHRMRKHYREFFTKDANRRIRSSDL